MQVSSPGADAVLAALMSIARTTRRYVDPELDKGQHWLLGMLHMQPGQRATELAESCGLDPSTVSRHLRQLEEDGRVRRQADPADGRAQLLFLTPAGEDVAAEANAQRRRLLLDPLNQWDGADVALLAELLTRLADAVAELAPEADQALAPGVLAPTRAEKGLIR